MLLLHRLSAFVWSTDILPGNNMYALTAERIQVWSRVVGFSSGSKLEQRKEK